MSNKREIYTPPQAKPSPWSHTSTSFLQEACLCTPIFVSFSSFPEEPWLSLEWRPACSLDSFAAGPGRGPQFWAMRCNLKLCGKAFVFLTQESYLFSPYSPRIQNTDLMAGAILAVLWLLWKGHETHKDLLSDVLKLMNQPSNQLPLYFLYVKQNKIKTNLELFKPLYLSR